MNNKTEWKWQYNPPDSNSIALFSNEGGWWEYEFHLRAGTTPERADRMVRTAYAQKWQPKSSDRA